MCWWLTDAEKISLSHLTEKFFMLFLVAPVSTFHSQKLFLCIPDSKIFKCLILTGIQMFCS